MFTELNIKATMTFLQQSITMAGTTSSVGFTSTMLKNKLKAALMEDYALPTTPVMIPVLRLISDEYQISYSPYRQVSPFVREKDMVVHCQLKLRYRKPYLGNRGLSENFRPFAVVKECLGKLSAVVGEGGGSIYGSSDMWAYMVIDRADRNRFREQTRNNNWEFIPRFFEGQDIPSSVFSGIGLWLFNTTHLPYLRSSSVNSLPFSFRIHSSAVLQNSDNSSGYITRLILGRGMEGDQDWYDTNQPRVNVGRIIGGPYTEQLVNNITSQIIEGDDYVNVWEGGAVDYEPDYESDNEPDNDGYEDYDYED